MIHRQSKRAIAPIAAVLIFCLTAGAQVGQVEKVDLEMMKKIREEGMQRSQVMETLSWMTDVVGPRLTGSPQMKHANEWTKDKMASWGMANAHLESWGPFGRGWTLEKLSANVIEPVPFPVIAYPKAWSGGTNGPITAEVILPEIKSDADIENYRGKLKGKIVLTQPMREVKALFEAPGRRLTDEQLLTMANADPQVQRGGPQAGATAEDQIRRFRETAELQRIRTEFFRSEGVAAMIDPGRGDGGTVFVQSDAGGSREKGAAPGAPSMVMAIEHYGRIARTLQKGVKVKMELDIQTKFHEEDLMSYNTVAEIPGADLKDEVVMLGGHLDSWHGGTGATDNAAGCAVAMEAARILKALGVQPRRTIRVALWSGEEQGLIGSRQYVNQHFAERQIAAAQPGQPPTPPTPGPQGRGAQGPITLKPEHQKFSVYFNLDNGTGKVRGVYLQGNEAARSIFRAWLAPFRDLGASTITIQNTGGTDHQSFDGVGLPGFQFIQDPIEYDTRTHHSNMDVYDRIQAEDMKQASVIMAAFVYNAAMRDEKFPRKPLPPNAVTVTVTAPAPPVAAEPQAPQGGKQSGAAKNAKSTKSTDKVKKQN